MAAFARSPPAYFGRAFHYGIVVAVAGLAAPPPAEARYMRAIGRVPAVRLATG